MKPLRFHPQAEQELAESVKFYNSRVPGLGNEFFATVESGAKEIQKDPLRRPIRPDGTRKLKLQRFPYLLIYRDEPTQILIVSVAHGARRPRFWKQRL
jgi:plasmid stabilization system protein ParE